MPGSDGLEFLVILNKNSELRFGLRRDELGFESGRGESNLWTAGCVPALVESELRADDGRTVNIEKLCLSLCVENLNLKKVIKVSYLNQESRQCLVFFGFLCVWTFYEHIYISHIPIMAMLHIYKYMNSFHCHNNQEIFRFGFFI